MRGHQAQTAKINKYPTADWLPVYLLDVPALLKSKNRLYVNDDIETELPKPSGDTVSNTVS